MDRSTFNFILLIIGSWERRSINLNLDSKSRAAEFYLRIIDAWHLFSQKILIIFFDFDFGVELRNLARSS